MKKDTLFIPGTYRENLPNLDVATVARYQNYRNTKPAYYWQVIEGLSPDVIMGRIYSGWRKIPSVPPGARLLGHYLDFGFDPDPVAVGSVYYFNGEYIVDEKLYANGVINADLAVHLKLLQPAPIIADSAEPKSIEELYRMRFNIHPCKKGADSIRNGISAMKEYKINITPRSVNIQREFSSYSWKQDKNGTWLPAPIDMFNHGIDAARYRVSASSNKIFAGSKAIF